MKKYILVLFALVMTLFSLSCLEEYVNQILDEISLTVTTESVSGQMGASTSRKIKARVVNGVGYTHTLYYVEADQIYSGTTAKTNINDYIKSVSEDPNVNIEEFKSNQNVGKITGQTTDIILQVVPQLVFELTVLTPNTIYLFIIESTHASKETIHTTIDSELEQGWFMTARSS